MDKGNFIYTSVQWQKEFANETKEAQLKVKEFSSKEYKSHRRVPETVASLFD